MFGFLGKQKQGTLLEYGFAKDLKEIKSGFFYRGKAVRIRDTFQRGLQDFREELLQKGFSSVELGLLARLYSDSQKIFLSRHGQTHRNLFRIENKGDPDLNKKCAKVPNELNDKGRLQAKALGLYLKEVILPHEEVLFITSTLNRTIETARIAASAMGVPFKTHSTPILDDMLCQDLLPPAALKSPWAQKEMKEGRLAPMHDIMVKCHSEVLRIADDHKDKTLVFVLHDQVNRGILLGFNYEVPKIYFTKGNASLVILERTGKNGFSVIQEFLRNKSMREILS